MRIALLSRQSRGYSTRRLKEAAQARGHKVRVMDTLRFAISLEKEAPDLLYKAKAVSTFDAVIPRIGASITFFGCAVVRQFEQMGVYTLNSAQGIGVSRDKLRAMQILSRHNVGMPMTSFVRSRSEVLPAIERVGGVPVIIKLIEGTQGIGVILARDLKVAEAIIETLQSARRNVLIQKFVSESKGTDLRALVVGDKVVAAMRRRAQGDEFRSNVHRGGKTQPVELDPEYERVAIRAAHIMGLNVAGVDMLETSEGPQVLEVNSSPGLEGIERATKVDVAGHIIEHLENQLLFPELDYRQRLSLGKGYAIAEVPVTRTSMLAGKSLAESRLKDRDVTVLSILRGELVIPNPGGSQMVLPGDLLVCFGKQAGLKYLIPPKPKRRRNKNRSSGGKSG
ncbi:MAG: RimK family alpha-L-glutamate ligase [Myxococcota bacterium]